MAFAKEKTDFGSGLPQIKILATGGTIAGKGKESAQMTEYTPGAIGIKELIDAVPEIKEYACISGEQIANIGSYAMTDDVWLKLADRINNLLSVDNVDGIVITHGTDTMEETAYFLNLVIKSKKPVILTGSMRPATAMSADGPLNLLNAVRLAASKEAHGKGVLVCMNDQINCAREVTKSNTTNVETFKATDFGCLGLIQNGKPYFYRQSTRRHTINSEFDISALKNLPRVNIIYAHASDDRALTDAAVAAGAKGIVHAGMGYGNMFPLVKDALSDARKKGIVVVKSSRTGSGLVPRTDADNEFDFVTGDNLISQKARILLMLALTVTNDAAQIQRIFDEY